ncbi:MAG: hypothetical protein AAFX06_01205 [Planctomycetota bacterium]
MSVTTVRWLVLVVLIALGFNAFLSVSQVRSQSKELAREREDLSLMVSRIDEIRAVENAPRVAALDIESPDEIVNRINEAVRKARLPRDPVASQTTSEPQRIERSDFSSRSVEIKLKAATVEQIVAFCDALKDESTGSVVRDLTLYNPQSSGSRETWESQMTLTQTIFSPKSDP